jgi:hypothetical protein
MKYIIVFFLIFGCGKKQLDNRIKEENNDTIGLINSKERETDFLSFFENFKRDSVFQINHVKFPYMFYYSDEDFPLDMMEAIIHKNEYAFIHFSEAMNTYPYTSSPFSMDIVVRKDSAFCIKQSTLNKTTIAYKFSRDNGSWYLVEIEDNTD